MRVTSIAIALSLCCTALPFAVSAAGNLNVVCSADVVVCEQMTRIFSETNPDINVSMVRLSAGEAYARLRSESRNPRTDIWWAGTGDPHMQAAEEGLTQEYKSPLLAEQHDWAQKQAENSNYRTVGIYAGALGWGYNTKLVADKKMKEPLCWADLLDPGFKGEIQIANPNSSGTAYNTLATLAQIMGEDEAFEYLKKLNANISQYTKSGSAPVKSAARGETAVGIVFMHDAVAMEVDGFPIKTVAPCEGTGYEIGSMSIVKGARNLANAKIWYDWALSAKAQSNMKDAKSYQLPSNREAAISEFAPRFENIKLIDYDFKTYGDSAKRKALLGRWDKEIGANAQ
ncbi:ABC transporter substrate-binding protein [Klebsiella sp. BIGb0407]|uniref:ABC transporter substrate-binding protein n=1 Tax=Klebsiella sp. BIGb0407 TaxID=2940603 RepID=UPI002168C2C1|nr:ABC transporter substrate-binding protein [Klebsiella sp. BIGb0407]MCS3430784.1 iron(III) transport system substrate-binding protein [Klebsiella sp. BIGb0407]